MIGKKRQMLGGMLLMIGAGALTGCQYEQLQQENEALWSQNSELQDELAQSRMALEAMEVQQVNLVADREQPQGMVDVFTTSVAANTGTSFGKIQGVEAIRGANQITVRIPGDVLFGSGKAGLRKSARKTLGEIAQVIRHEYPGNTISIKGYTDTDPIKKSKWRDNLELSLHRSATVFRYLEKQGIKPANMEAGGRGQWHARKTKAKSRRVEIVVELR